MPDPTLIGPSAAKSRPSTRPRPRVWASDSPAAPFVSSNRFGIPDLDPSLQAGVDDGPFVQWGSVSRRSINRAGWHFFTEDYKFAGLWSHPETVLNTHAAAIVEPNYSTSPGIPQAVAIWLTYKKRWLARFYQTHGIRIVVDLNVDVQFQAINLLGVPSGWRSFAIRAHAAYGVEAIRRDFAAAVGHAGTDQITFMVFGGGKAVRELCESQGWHHTPETGVLAKERLKSNGQGQGITESEPAEREAVPRRDTESGLGREYEPGPAGPERQGEPVGTPVGGEAEEREVTGQRWPIPADALAKAREVMAWAK